MSASAQQLRTFVLDEAKRLGFDSAGIASVREFPELRLFADWLANGSAGEMHYLARKTDGSKHYLREDVRNAFPWARSVICCAQVYNSPYPRSIDCTSADRGWISRYGWGDDYHEHLLERMRTLKASLEQSLGEAELRAYVDTGPLVERVYAKAAGIGWTGKNTCLLDEKLGSYFFIGTLVCSLDIAADSPAPDRCGSCTRCIDACPTSALDTPYQMDASRCIAYLNIELRGSIPEQFRPAMGHNIFGCDICQDVCPWNSRAPVTLAPEFQPRAGAFHPELTGLASMPEEDYRQRFRHSAVKRARYLGLLRNVAVVMGNSGNAAFIPALEQLSHHADAVVREHAEWALRQLKLSSQDEEYASITTES